MSDLTPGEQALADVYAQLKAALEEHGEDLPPFAAANARKALGALWQVANGLDLDPGQLYYIGT